MTKIFCVSGLGSDEQIFSNLSLPGYELVFIQWLIPELEESIAHYSARLSKQITDENPILLGVSFGGMICIELSKIIKTKCVVLISTIKTRAEMPKRMKAINKLQLHKLFKPEAHGFFEPFQNYNLGVSTNEEKEMVRNYRKNVDRRYLDWAIENILKWNNTIIPANTFHIHGSNDRIFPIKNIKPDLIIKDGRHLMIHDKSPQISIAIQNFIKSC